MSTTCTRPISGADFQREVVEHTGDVLVDFYTTWCPPCKAMAPVLDSVCAERGASLKVLKVDAEESVELATRMEIRSVPTFILFRNGEPVARTKGLQSKPTFDQWINQSLA